jgi:hypothetical protein
MKTALVVGCFGAAIVAVSAAQGPATIVPTWQNLETWNRYDTTLGQTELGLGFQPANPRGGASLAFWAKFRGKIESPPANEIYAAGAVGQMADQNLVRTASFMFLIDEGKPQWAAIDLSPHAIGDEQHPTRTLKSVVARISAADFLRLTRARRIKARVLATEQELSREQLDALKAFSRRILQPSR